MQNVHETLTKKQNSIGAEKYALSMLLFFFFSCSSYHFILFLSQAQPVPEDIVRTMAGNRASFSPIVTVEPRRRKFHKPITMTIPVPPRAKEAVANGRKGEPAPCLRLMCSITGM